LFGFRSLLAGNAELDVLQVETAQVGSLVEQVREFRPGMVVLDQMMTNGSTMKWLSAIKAEDPALAIILVSDDAGLDHGQEILDHNVKGCVSLSAETALLAKAIDAVRRGGLWLPRHLLERRISILQSRLDAGAADFGPAPQPRVDELTERERMIAEWVGQGLTNKQIAKELGISSETVKRHVRNIFAKLGLRRRSELAFLVANDAKPRPFLLTSPNSESTPGQFRAETSRRSAVPPE
jgi:DNA-binding NarL/FixJ family response regulator